MKAKTKRSTRSVLFIGLVFLAIVSLFCAVFSMNAGKNGAVVDAAENVLIDFSASETTVVSKGGFGSASAVKTTEFTSGNGADSVLKATWEAGWKDVSFEFGKKVLAENVSSLTIRFYAHLTEGSAACGMWTSLSGEDLKWYDFNDQNKWVDLTFNGEAIAKMANADGYIDGFIVSINYNQGTPYSDAYIMFDSVTYEEKIVPPAGTITEFRSGDTTVLNKVGFEGIASSVTNINFTSGNGADSVLKATWETGWKDVSFEFGKKVLAENVSSLTIRFYAHLTEGSAACADWSSLSGKQFKWYDFNVQNEWTEITVSGSDVAKLANADGYIDGFIVSINYNQGTPYSDAYIMFDSVTYEEYKKVTFVHGGEIENEIVKLSAGEKVTAAQCKKAGYTVEWYADAELTNKFDFNTAITADTVLYAKYKVGSVYGASVSLEGDVAMNFYVTLSDTTLADENAKIRFTFDGKTTEVAVTEGVVKEVYRVYTYNVAAKDYDKNVTMTVVSSEGEGVSVTCSVKEYVAKIAAGGYDANVKTLAARLVNYCEAAKDYFADTEVEAKYTTEVTDETVETTLKSYKAVIEGTADEGVTVLGASLVLESKTAIRVYFTGENAASAVVKVNGEVVKAKTLEQNEKTYYYVEVENIAANDLDAAYVIEIGSYKVTYSALSYVYANLTNEGTAVSLANVLRAMYLYNQAADAYVAA